MLNGGKIDRRSSSNGNDAARGRRQRVGNRFSDRRLREQARRAGYSEPKQLKGALRAALLELLRPIAQPLDVSTHKPFIIMLAGVNGAGKTTSIGKIASYYQQAGKSVLLAAGDTFRAPRANNCRYGGNATTWR